MLSVQNPGRLSLLGFAAVYVGVVGLLATIKQVLFDEPNCDVPLSTTHPAVPPDVFSVTYQRREDKALRAHRGDRWLFTYGDKVCHSALSLALYLAKGANIPDSDSEALRRLYSLYFQAALAETRWEIESEAAREESADAMLECVALTILETPLAQLEHYTALMALPEEEERRAAVVRQAEQAIKAPRGMKGPFRAAHVLMRLVILFLLCDTPYRRSAEIMQGR